MTKYTLALSIILIAQNNVNGFTPRRHGTFGKIDTPVALDSYLDDLFGAEPLQFSPPSELEVENNVPATGNYLEALTGAQPFSYTASAPAEPVAPAAPASGNYMDALSGAQPFSYTASAPAEPVAPAAPASGNYMDALSGAQPFSYTVSTPAEVAPAAPASGNYMDALSGAQPISFSQVEPSTPVQVESYANAAFIQQPSQYAAPAPNTGSYLQGLSGSVQSSSSRGFTTSFLDTLSAAKAASVTGVSRAFLDSLSGGYTGTLSGPATPQALSFLDSLAYADPLPPFPQSTSPEPESVAYSTSISSPEIAPIQGSYLDALNAMTPQKVVGYLDSISKQSPQSSRNAAAPMVSYIDSLQGASNFDSIQMVSSYLDSLNDSTASLYNTQSYQSASSMPDSTVSHQSLKVELLRETLRESKQRSRESVDSSIFERSQAEEKIAMMEQKYHAEKLKIESELEQLKLENQNRIKDGVS